MTLALDQLGYEIVTSRDGTSKLRVTLDDRRHVEACILDLAYRRPSRVICISSQVGCPFTCAFCASGHRAFLRNLTSSEIVRQVEICRTLTGDSEDVLFDVTYMGIGEPLANLTHVPDSMMVLVKAYGRLNKINVSTIAPREGVERLAAMPLPGRLHLQFSLHSPFDSERSQLLRRRDLPSIAQSLKSLAAFAVAQKDVPCVNYLLFDGVNDSARHAGALASLLAGLPVYVKLSTVTPIQESTLRASPHDARMRFADTLTNAGIKVKTFASQGQDVRAGCGQLIAESS